MANNRTDRYRSKRPVLSILKAPAQPSFSITQPVAFFLDIFALSVEAGAGTVLALQSTVEALPFGPLRSLIEQALFDIRSGLSREHSFKKLALDSGIPELATLASSIENAVQMGLSLVPVLRSQSDQYRQERFLRAEKAALEAPVKMLLPIVSCIFPCTFLVIAYPIVYGLLSSL
ncbi:type II secretion system F family protein [Paenalcaligenes niemegkensis]|uniref:type II secretion system F family protein n=1 Tax=Paenalcaligenes niemegkensis TaxID=2895469 RepID=UPI001EE8A426|nr:type II secretion system F family protein [Paenalcaligenes niemegkensis]MCQ9616210.1 type II secretion system F family protein [Paenalcaligenes niemegkensis]